MGSLHRRQRAQKRYPVIPHEDAVDAESFAAQPRWETNIATDLHIRNERV